MTETILIVEDEADLADTVAYNLEREGFATRVALNGKEALEKARMEPAPDLVLLDLMLPDLSGTEICRQLRADKRTQHTPIIMVTARGEEIDRVVGFEVGADDYVVKPFSVRELMLRVKAILRRSRGDSSKADDEILSFGMLKLDRGGHRVWVEEDEITLTALEFKLLDTLLSRKGRVQSREVLLADVWDIRADVTTRTVDTHVKRLRQKLGPAGDYVETLRGVGYRWMADAQRLAG
jgi:two-component system phosphate regulon response regulator PhoB